MENPRALRYSREQDGSIAPVLRDMALFAEHQTSAECVCAHSGTTPPPDVLEPGKVAVGLLDLRSPSLHKQPHCAAFSPGALAEEAQSLTAVSPLQFNQ